MSESHLILASGSPRRRELLTLMGIDFTVCPVDVDERLSGQPADVVMALADDTLVSRGQETLGKPADEADAHRMLMLLSGEMNTVYSGVCVIDGKTGRKLTRCDSTDVYFTEIDEEAAWRYIRSGEPMDKAGAYGVQGMGGMFVRSVSGSPSNVIGLPMHLVREMLRSIGWKL